MKEFIEVPCSKMSLVKRKLVYGIGNNDSNYKTQYVVNGKKQNCPYYVSWHSMLQRCYAQEWVDKHPTYIGCSVCKEWLTFSNFKRWMKVQDWQDKVLDKDILIKGNKLYSPNTCMFVTQAINKLLLNSCASRGQYVIGVSWNTKSKKYQAHCSYNNKQHFLGYFLSEDEAHQAYLKFKKELIITIANEQTDVKLKQALLHIANTEY